MGEDAKILRRRQFLQWAGGLSAALLVVGCGDGADEFVFSNANNPQAPAPDPLGRLIARGAIEALDDGRLVELRPRLVSVYGAGGNLLFTSTDAVLPAAAVSDGGGRIFVLDRGAGRVLVLGAAGGLENTFAESLHGIVDLALTNGEVFLLHPVRQAIDVFSTEGVFARTFTVGPERAHLRAIADSPNGDIYVLRSNPVSVIVISPQGQELRTFAPPDGVARNASGLAVNAAGRSAIVDHVGQQVLLFNQNNQFVAAVTIPDGNGNIAQPLAVGYGPDGQLHASYAEVIN